MDASLPSLLRSPSSRGDVRLETGSGIPAPPAPRLIFRRSEQLYWWMSICVELDGAPGIFVRSFLVGGVSLRFATFLADVFVRRCRCFDVRAVEMDGCADGLAFISEAATCERASSRRVGLRERPCLRLEEEAREGSAWGGAAGAEEVECLVWFPNIAITVASEAGYWRQAWRGREYRERRSGVWASGCMAHATCLANQSSSFAPRRAETLTIVSGSVEISVTRERKGREKSDPRHVQCSAGSRDGRRGVACEFA